MIDTGDSETPVRQSRRIAQQKIREETERRDMEERMLKKMKEEAERKKKSGSVTNDTNFDPADEQKDSASDDSYKEEGSRRKKKTKIKPSDKPWQTSSSHSEHSETDPDEFEHPRSEDPGSPLFRSDHEFSPESDVDDVTQVQPVKRARTAKKQVEESSDEEDVNPNHACQVCKKTDSPEWILLCDECDCGYHCSCLKPIIFCIPSGNWYCPLCCHKKLIVNLSEQLEKLDCLVSEIEAEELKKQRQIEARKLTEITAENILKERRKNRLGGARGGGSEEENNDKGDESSEGDNDNESKSKDSSDSSDDAPLIYKLRRRNQTAASYRFNEYDDLINSAIRKDMDEVKGMGNAGRGKDISTIIEADKEEKKQQRLEKERAGAGGDENDDDEKESDKEQGEAEDHSSGSEIGKNKKAIHRKKKNRKLNNLEDTSEEDAPSDEDFKGTSSSNSDTEDYSGQSSVSESSLDLPLKKGKNNARRTRSAANKRQDQRFINDNESSDDEPLIKKRVKKQNDSDEEDFDGAEDNSDDSTADEIDSDDLCDDTETSSSESNWPKKKKRVASYDKKPRKPAKKHDEDDDKAFRAGISKKKILKKESENESNGSGSDTVRGKRKTRGKKLLYLLEDDYESDDGIKPGVGVVRPETPEEERELFRLKQEEIKKMLAAKNTEAARQLAVPTIEPIQFDMEMPRTPSPPPIAEGSSLSTIPKNVIEGAKALDMDYNRIKPVVGSSKLGGNSLAQQEMSEEELAKMMEEEDFAQHQLKLAGEAIARNRLLDLEGKEEAFVPFSKSSKEKLPTPAEPKKPRMKKSKIEKNEPPAAAEPPPKLMEVRPPVQQQQQQQLPPSHPIHSPQIHGNLPPPLISNASHQPPPSHLPPYAGQPVRFPPHHQMPPHNVQERPSVLNNFPPRPEMHPHHPASQSLHQQMRFHLQHPPEGFMQKAPPTLLPPQIHHQQQQLPQSPEDEEKVKKGGRRKKFTPLRQDLPEANVSKVAKLDANPPVTAASVIHSTLNLSAATDRAPVEDKNKGKNQHPVFYLKLK